MSMTFHCDIVSLEASIFSGLVKTVVATGDQGELGIFFNHAPLLTKLIPGPVRVVMDNGEEEVYYVSGGYLEVQPNAVNILADTALRASDLSEAEAEKAQAAAKAAVANMNGEFDYSKAAIQLAEAAAQIRTLQKLRNKK